MRSEDRRLPPCAPHAAQGVAHLAERRVGAGGVHDRGHQVGVRHRVGLEPAQYGLDAARIPPLPHRPHALDLLRLQCGVDAEDLDRGLLGELVPVESDDDPLAPLDLALVAEGGLGDPARRLRTAHTELRPLVEREGGHEGDSHLIR